MLSITANSATEIDILRIYPRYSSNKGSHTINLTWTMTSYTSIQHTMSTTLNVVNIVSPTSNDLPSTADRTTAAFSEKTVAISRYSVEPTDIASGFPLTYTYTYSSGAALPSWIEIDDTSDSSNILFTMKPVSLSDVATHTIKYSGTATSTATGSTKTEDYTFYLYVSDPCINSN